MAAQDEVTWLLGVIKDNYPTAFPSDLLRRNRDDSYNLETDERTQAAPTDTNTTVGVATGSTQREFFGQKPQYRTTTTLDVRVEAKHDSEWGQVTDIQEFDTLVNDIQDAINSNITYPTVDADADSRGKVEYHDLAIVDEQPQSSNYKDYYRTDFSVRLRGAEDT